MNEEMISFLDTVIPTDIPKKKRQSLFDEMSCHLEEKAEHFKSIGFSDEESTKKACDAFAQTQDAKQNISNNFDEMYHERTWWAFAAAVGVVVLEILCFLTGSWIYSVDKKADPDIPEAAISFGLVFVFLAFIAFARIKNLRKTLLGVAAGTVFCLVPLWNVFAQSAIFTVIHGLVYFTNNYTGIYIENPSGVAEVLEWAASSAVLPLAAIAYCISASLRIKHGTAKKLFGRKVTVGCTALAALYVCSAVLFSAALPTVKAYMNEPAPLKNEMFMTMWTDRIYSDLESCETLEECDAVLREHKMKTLDEYRESLSRAKQKEFDRQIKEMKIPSDLITYTLNGYASGPVMGNGFIFLKTDNGRITLKGVGSTYVPEEGEAIIARTDPEHDDTALDEAIKLFTSLKKGMPEKETSVNFGFQYGTKFAKFRYGKDMNTSAYRIFFRNRLAHGDEIHENYYACIMNLIFTDGELTDADMRCDIYTEEDGLSSKYYKLGDKG